MIWHSGLRGSMAFALAALLDPETVERRAMLVTSTLALVLITTVGIGSSTPLALRLLRIQTGDMETTADVVAAERRAEAAPAKSTLGRWTRLDRQYLMPFLSNRYVTPPAVPSPTTAAAASAKRDGPADDEGDYLDDYDALMAEEAGGRTGGDAAEVELHGLTERPEDYDEGTEEERPAPPTRGRMVGAGPSSMQSPLLATTSSVLSEQW
jgi:hypothetical protein